MWSVRVLSGVNAGQIFDLKLGKNILGRGPQCDFKVLSVGISKEHCEIHVYKDKLIIVDLKSSNGTFVNGVKIQNSIIRVGDKLSLFDVIMDVIPTPEIRPKPTNIPVVKAPSSFQTPANSFSNVNVPPVPVVHQAPPPAFSVNGSNALNMQYQQEAPAYMQSPIMAQVQQNVTPAEAPVTFQQKFEKYFDQVVMPAIYNLAAIFPFKHILIGFVLIFVFGVTLLSVFPLTTIMKESNYIEATKRAKSVARAMAKINEQALLSGQYGSLSVQDAMKEDGIKEALIIQQSDGLIIAPSEKAGRDVAKSFILQARKESRSSAGQVDSNTIGASYPIGVYDPISGEPIVKYHAIVFYDVSSLNADDGRIISLFMQTLIIASVLGLILYFLFAKLIEYPIKNLNQQIDKALREKTDQTVLAFEDPTIQSLVSNVNTLLNRAMNSSPSTESIKPAQNRDIEYSNLVDMITQPAFVVAADNRMVCLNSSFEQILQISKENIINQTYLNLTDSALVQNIESLMVRAQQSPYEKHVDRIPFAQFECDIQCQLFLDSNSQPEYYLMTLNKADGHS